MVVVLMGAFSIGASGATGTVRRLPRAGMLKRILLGPALVLVAAGVPAQAPEGDAPAVVEQAPGATPAPPEAPSPTPSPEAPEEPEAAAPPEPAPAAPSGPSPVAPPAPAAVEVAPPPPPTDDVPNEERRRANLSEFERKVEVEEAGKRAEQAVETGRAGQEEAETERLLREAAAEARRRAAAERRAEARQRLIERERSCVIKPVMTDAEIAHCKWVWSFPPPPG